MGGDGGLGPGLCVCVMTRLQCHSGFTLLVANLKSVDKGHKFGRWIVSLCAAVNRDRGLICLQWHGMAWLGVPYLASYKRLSGANHSSLQL